MPKAEALFLAKRTLRTMTRAEVERRVDSWSPDAEGTARSERVGKVRVQRPTDRPFEDPYYWAPFILIGSWR